MIRCGFFNSVNGDRLYQADDMTKPYENLVSNGVFATQSGTPSNYLQVYAEQLLSVRVKAGRGVFFDKWFLSDSDIVLSLETAHATLPRIDSIVVKVDKSENVRAATIEVKKGTPNSTPVAPTLTRSDYIKEYRLANIRVNANDTTILQSNIQDTRGLSECGWVTSLIQQVDTSTLYEQWQAGFDEWFRDVKETLSTATLIRSYNSVYTTTNKDEFEIPIGITQYNQNLDILQVYINGLMLIKDVEYTITSNSIITLTKPVDKGTPVSFVVYKSIDGSDAETVVSQVVELQEDVEKIRITSLTGGVKRSVTSGDLLTTFRTLGVGFHTLLVGDAVTGTPTTGQYWRCFGQITDSPYGWLIAISSEGKAWLNFANGDTSWTGWRELTNTTSPKALYTSTNGVFPNSNAEIIPSKALPDCQHGWQLVFSGYDDTEKVPRDVYVQTVQIPKLSHKNAAWNGESVTFPLISQYVNGTDTVEMCQKTFSVYPNRIVAGSTASTGNQRKLVLRAIYEY